MIQQKNNEIESLKEDICNLKSQKTSSATNDKDIDNGVKLAFDKIYNSTNVWKIFILLLPK